jgi:hypothetical protein
MRLVVALAFAAFAIPAAADNLDALVAKHAAANGVPEQLIRRVIKIESRGNAGVVHAGNYGLMQIRLGTAKAMGYTGDAKGLLDADTNMTYAVRYLAGAYRAAGGNHDRAVHYYQRGYYDVAKTKGFSPYQTASAPVVTSETSAVPMQRAAPVSDAPAAVSEQPVTAKRTAKPGKPSSFNLLGYLAYYGTDAPAEQKRKAPRIAKPLVATPAAATATTLEQKP